VDQYAAECRVRVNYDMKTYGGSGDVASSILTSALDRDVWSAWGPERFTPGAHWMGWVGSTAGLAAASHQARPGTGLCEIRMSDEHN
jgi:hypothetical protein